MQYADFRGLAAGLVARRGAGGADHLLDPPSSPGRRRSLDLPTRPAAARPADLPGRPRFRWSCPPRPAGGRRRALRAGRGHPLRGPAWPPGRCCLGRHAGQEDVPGRGAGWPGPQAGREAEGLIGPLSSTPLVLRRPDFSGSLSFSTAAGAGGGRANGGWPSPTRTSRFERLVDAAVARREKLPSRLWCRRCSAWQSELWKGWRFRGLTLVPAALDTGSSRARAHAPSGGRDRRSRRGSPAAAPRIQHRSVRP